MATADGMHPTGMHSCFDLIVLLVYLCFELYFLLDHRFKIQSELTDTDMLKNRPNVLNFYRVLTLDNYCRLREAFATVKTNSAIVLEN